MTTFPALDAAASGARVADSWMTAIANNLANVNTIRPAGQEPFRAQKLVLEPDRTGGVRITDVVEQDGTPDRSYEPGNPLADADGYVTRPVVDMTEEMTAMIIAQRMYQANLSVHQQVRDSYRAALQIGKT
jgi:flagellar basal-body rod protein FlgC